MKEKFLNPVCQLIARGKDLCMVLAGYMYICFKIRSLNNMSRS